MLLNKIVAPAIACLLFTPLVGIPASLPVDSDEPPPPDYALSVNTPSMIWYIFFSDHDQFKTLTYFLFYTFFKCGTDPDCIDLIVDDEFKSE